MPRTLGMTTPSHITADATLGLPCETNINDPMQTTNRRAWHAGLLMVRKLWRPNQLPGVPVGSSGSRIGLVASSVDSSVVS
jgi:hypothetical protein